MKSPHESPIVASELSFNDGLGYVNSNASKTDILANQMFKLSPTVLALARSLARLPRRRHVAADVPTQQSGAAEMRILLEIYLSSKVLGLKRVNS